MIFVEISSIGEVIGAALGLVIFLLFFWVKDNIHKPIYWFKHRNDEAKPKSDLNYNWNVSVVDEGENLKTYSLIKEEK